MLSKRTPI